VASPSLFTGASHLAAAVAAVLTLGPADRSDPLTLATGKAERTFAAVHS